MAAATDILVRPIAASSSPTPLRHARCAPTIAIAALANLTSYMSQRAVSEGGAALPTTFYLDIYSFDNILESSDTK